MMGCHVRRSAPERTQERRATDTNKTTEHASSGTKTRHAAGPVIEPPIIHGRSPLVSVANSGKTARLSLRLDPWSRQPALQSVAL
jgi:hypothetical protein